jgi:hypothetical protein
VRLFASAQLLFLTRVAARLLKQMEDGVKINDIW